MRHFIWPTRGGVLFSNVGIMWIFFMSKLNISNGPMLAGSWQVPVGTNWQKDGSNRLHCFYVEGSEFSLIIALLIQNFTGYWNKLCNWHKPDIFFWRRETSGNAEERKKRTIILHHSLSYVKTASSMLEMLKKSLRKSMGCLLLLLNYHPRV